MSEETFLIDANSLITPHLTFYPFDFAPGFWDQLEQAINDGKIVVLDMVKAEILHGNDALKDWMENLEIKNYIDHREPCILQKYSAILQHVQNSPWYKPAALNEWSRKSVADAWIIATAAAYNYTIITFEEANKGLSAKNPSKNAKIPDVASVFNVKTEKLYYMIRALGFKLM